MDYCIRNNCIKDILFNADNIEFSSYEERKKYLEYKDGLLGIIDSDLELKFNILSLLEEMGFSINRLGTYFYRDIVFKLVKELKWLDGDSYIFIVNQIRNNNMNGDDVVIEDVLRQHKEKLLKELVEPYSQFYFDIARNDNDIGTKTFHAYIQNSFEKLDREKEKYGLLIEFANNNGNKLNYGQLAFVIASYILKNGFAREFANDCSKRDFKIRVRVDK